MRRVAYALWAIVAATLLSPFPALAQQAKPTIAHTFLKVGEMAPDFTLHGTHGVTIRLSDFRGKKNVILAFYVLAFTQG